MCMVDPFNFLCSLLSPHFCKTLERKRGRWGCIFFYHQAFAPPQFLLESQNIWLAVPEEAGLKEGSCLLFVLRLQESHLIVLDCLTCLTAGQWLLPSEVYTRPCLMYLTLSFRDLSFLECYEACRAEQHFESQMEGKSRRAIKLDMSQLTSLSPLWKATPWNIRNFQAGTQGTSLCF